MMYYIQIFYSYILPPMALFGFALIIHLQISRKVDFEDMEAHFLSAIDNNKKHSNKAIQDHFRDMQSYTNQALQKLDTDAREQLEQTLSSFEDINKAQRALGSQLTVLQRANAELHNEIKKRDAIIERKTKQIQRLKDAV